jgi:PAS domain S-box-containing protein
MYSLFKGFCLVVLLFPVVARGEILSSAERLYLQQNPEIRFATLVNYPPFEFIDDNGERQGMSIELIRWISTEFGFQAVFSDMTIQEAREAVLSGEADVITSFVQTDPADSLLGISEPLFDLTSRIFILSGTTGVSSLASLQGRTVAVQTGNYSVEFLQEEAIDCTVVEADNSTDALHLLLDGEVEALIGEEQIVEFHLSNHHSLDDAVAVGEVLYTEHIRMGISEEDSLLYSIVNKGIIYAEKEGIISGISAKWRGSPFHLSERSKFPYLVQILAAFAFILSAAVLFLLWNLRLRHAVEKKTDFLKDSENRLHQALDQAKLGSWDCDIVTGEVVNNDRYSLMLGYSPGEMDFSMSGWLSLVHPADRQRLKSYMDGFLKEKRGQFESEYRMKTSDGNWISIHSSGGVTERDQNGKPIRIAGIHQDVTRRKHSEHMARKAVEDWENTFDALPELIAVLDSEGTIIRVNKAQAKALGLTRDECKRKKLCSLMFPGDKAYLSRIPDLLAGKIKDTQPLELYIQKYGGDFEISMAISEDPVDGSIRIIHVARNITSRKAAEKKQKEMEERVQHTQKLESLGVLAGGIAHDFNNILMAIRGYTDLAISCVDEKDQVFLYLNEINKSVRTASELSGQMLAYSGRGNFVIETASINEIIENLKPMLQVSVSRKAELQLDLVGKLPKVRVDSTQMEQVILNLLTNASEAIGSSSGKITVATGQEKRFPPGGQDRQEEKVYVFIQVEDTGTGMSDEVLQKLFEPFFTTKFTGRGLGMAVVQGIVEGHNGFIEVSSKLGSGSSLKVFIPGLEEAAISPESDEEGESSVRKKAGIGVLLVDDEKNILFIGKHTLTKAGYIVYTAADGEKAVEEYRNNSEAIHCVVLDLTMPVMDGVECFRELKKLDPAVKVILSSGYNQQEIENRIRLKEIAGYLKKPYGLSTLRSEVKKALRS